MGRLRAGGFFAKIRYVSLLVADYPPNPNVANYGDVYSGYGVVHSIELVQQDQRENTGSH
ncbi:MAG: hypothetical protein H6R17_4031 [Proteobacteria bacterium]|nr:hypothetical protein [Pseudomonadota bacterium]